MVLMILCNIYILMFFLLRIAVYILWQITRGRKDLIVQLRRQIVNVSKTCFCVFLYLCTVPILWFFINSYCCFPSLSSSVLSLIFSHQEGKDKSFLLDKLRKLQKSNKKPAQNNQKRVCPRISFMLTNQTSLWHLLSNSPHRPFFLMSFSTPTVAPMTTPQAVSPSQMAWFSLCSLTRG